MMSKIAGLCAGAFLWLAAAAPAKAQISDDAVRLVVLNDQSSAYSDTSGRGSVVAAELAVEDFGRTVAGKPIQVVGADHQNKVDLAATLVKRMIDGDRADAFFDIANSGVSLAIQDTIRQANKVVVHVGSGNVDLVGKACTPNSALWLYDTHALAKGLATALLSERHRRWFLLTADYAFGHAMQRDMTDTLRQRGGEVVGSVRHPLNTMDFGSFLFQGAGANLQVLALLNAGADTTGAIKQAAEFGMMRNGVKLAVPIFTIVNVKAIGLDLSQGTTFLAGYYWDRDDPSRAFARRFEARMGRPPTHAQAAVYSAVLHYLKSVEASGTDAGDRVMAQMKELPVNDFMTANARLRADGRLMRDMLLVEVKTPAESRGAWDLMHVRATIAAGDMIKPVEESECPLARRS
ncbi:ABC transporter substrate-binding protein [Phreatobacter stygius]|nr:ABC transporter substrate-binding protein [Phreatobacter stygius]